MFLKKRGLCRVLPLCSQRTAIETRLLARYKRVRSAIVRLERWRISHRYKFDILPAYWYISRRSMLLLFLKVSTGTHFIANVWLWPSVFLCNFIRFCVLWSVRFFSGELWRPGKACRLRFCCCPHGGKEQARQRRGHALLDGAGDHQGPWVRRKGDTALLRYILLFFGRCLICWMWRHLVIHAQWVGRVHFRKAYF